MADANEPEVKDVERVEIEPAGDDEETVDAEETAPDSSQEENPDDAVADDTDTTKPDQIVTAPTPTPAPAKAEPQAVGDDDLAVIEGETPRERALRLEVTRLRKAGRQDRANEILGSQETTAADKPEISPERKKVLEKYNPEEISALRETIDVLAEEMGFVRKDQLTTTTYVDRANDELNAFLDKHPEYLPENDKDGTLWTAFKNEYGLYKQPSNPKDFTKIFERVHRDVFGIKPARDLSKTAAAGEKVKVASHATNAPAPAVRQRTAAPQGLRTDMLKGFSDEELAELTG